jgi:hypothetical protein
MFLQHKALSALVIKMDLSLIGQDPVGKALIVQASNPPVPSSLFDHCHDRRQIKQ